MRSFRSTDRERQAVRIKEIESWHFRDQTVKADLEEKAVSTEERKSAFSAARIIRSAIRTSIS